MLRKQTGASYVLNIATVCGTGKDTTSWQREMIRFDEASGFIYLFGAIFIGLKFVIDSYVLMITKSNKKAIGLFKYSITYLALIFALLLLDHYWYLNIF